jgi:predicted metal-dependent hydrolase
MKSKVKVALMMFVLLVGLSVSAGAQTIRRRPNGRTVVVLQNRNLPNRSWQNRNRNWRGWQNNRQMRGARTMRLPNGRLVTILPDGRRIYH